MVCSDTVARNNEATAQDARSFALMLISQFGERASAYAAYQALKARARGDARNAGRWRWMAEVTRLVLRSDPEGTVAP